MGKLLNTLRYIIKTGTDACYIDMAKDLLDELKSYDKFGDEYTRIDDTFKIMTREQIAAWLCRHYYIESADCDCETCIYNCRG